MTLWLLVKPVQQPTDKIEEGILLLKNALLPEDFKQTKALYHRLIDARNAFNMLFAKEFDCYLEDEWNEYAEGETWIEYRIRSLITKDEFPPIASDIYLNHQDEGGVWHLGDYQHSLVKLTTFEELALFLATHRYEGQA